MIANEGRVRLLITDDAAFVRKLVQTSLEADPRIEIAGVAANGRICITKIPEVHPDVVVLDVEMPEMDGFATLGEIRKLYPTLPVILFSSLTEHGATVTLDALALGASDYVTKPPATIGGLAAAADYIRATLGPKVIALGHRYRRQAIGAPPAPAPQPTTPALLPPPTRGGTVDVLVIGASTGGPNAVQTFLEGLFPRINVPILLVQHMPPVFTRLFAERLGRIPGCKAREAIDGEPIIPGTVLVAPGNQHLEVSGSATAPRVRLTQAPPENSCRPAVDVLFRSAATVWGGNTLGVVLTGMGMDGLRGSEVIRKAGGNVLVQDEATSIVWGMPGSIANSGLADAVLPIGELAPEVLRRLRRVRPGVPVPAGSERRTA